MGQTQPWSRGLEVNSCLPRGCSYAAQLLIGSPGSTSRTSPSVRPQMVRVAAGNVPNDLNYLIALSFGAIVAGVAAVVLALLGLRYE